MSEIFHPSHSRYNTRMAILKLDLPFRQSCLGQKTISYLGPKTWNNLPAEIKLRRCVNTCKHHIKKLFFDKLKKQSDDIFFCYHKRTPTRLFFHFPLHILFLHVCTSTPICSLYPQRDHNENKVYLDLYYVIPATVSLNVEFFRPV